MNNFQSDMDNQKKDLEDLTRKLHKEQQELDTIRDSLQGESPFLSWICLV